MERDVLLNVSPIDGRYYEITKDLEEYFSEYAYIKHRVLVECEWLKFFCKSLVWLKNLIMHIEEQHL